MIKLSNVSKYYHSDSGVALGLRKINLELNVGEFIAITGESGSGKSTLLNVISGNDTYEEGELFINGEETSHFIESDWEKYRRDYVGFIFQNNNLIDSYTVYENVLSALIIQGLDKKNRKKRAKEIIKKVGLTSHLKHKAIKLSGGQKQRLAIARALAKDVPIIVADEPTGNLDSESGKEIIKLLNEVSKDKLVVIVTHNFEQTKEYVSRKIRLYDGEIVEDIELKSVQKIDKINATEHKNTVFKKSIKFGLLNLKSQPIRTAFLLIISLLFTIIIFNIFGNYLASQDRSDEYNSYYSTVNNIYKERIIVSKKDKSAFTVEDDTYINSLSKVKRVIKQDLALDAELKVNLAVENQSFYFMGFPYPSKYLNNSDLKYGRLPETYDEIVIEAYLYSSYSYAEQLNKTVKLNIHIGNSIEEVDVKIVGFIKSDSYFDTFYISNDLLNFIDLKQRNAFTSTSSQGDLQPLSYFEVTPLDETPEIELYYQYTLETNFEDASTVINTLLKNGYYAFSPHINFADSFDFLGIFEKFFLALTSIINMIIIYFVGYLIFRYILLFKKKDYAILKSIGIEQKSIKTMNFVELYVSFLIAFAILIPLYFIILDFKTKYDIGIFSFIGYYKWYHFIFLLMINTLLCILLVRRYNKSLVKNSILSNLRVE